MLMAFNSTGVFPPDSWGLIKQYMPPMPISWPCVSFVAMSFCSTWIWTVFCTEWFPESLVLHPAGIFKEIFAQLSTWASLEMFDPLENNHGWNRTKYCAILFFSIRSLEITNILACDFSPFPSFFDFLWRRNNIFIFWNIGAVSASVLTHLWNIQAYFKTIFSLRKEIEPNFSLSHWPAMQGEDGNLSCFSPDLCSPQMTGGLRWLCGYPAPDRQRWVAAPHLWICQEWRSRKRG